MNHDEHKQRIADAVLADMDATEESEWKLLLGRIPVLAQQDADELTLARLMFSQGFLAGTGFGFTLAAKTLGAVR